MEALLDVPGMAITRSIRGRARDDCLGPGNEKSSFDNDLIHILAARAAKCCE
ncbi:hypothetical protein IG631_05472 [Alternaria alternata]|nr:hypothetical protein IG631_05472 [Alternaria alternata]